MVAQTSGAPVAPTVEHPAHENVHLMLVETPRLTLRGRIWLERAHLDAFDGAALERLIRLEKLNLG